MIAKAVTPGYKRPVRPLLVVAAILSLASAVVAQEAPKDLRDWELICFCSGNPTPQSILDDDNNGQILYAARAGVTRDQLKAEGIPFTESQIQLLKEWRLLAESEGELRVAIPVLGPGKMARLRARVHGPAVELGKSLGPDFQRLVAALDRQGNASSSYAIVFSYMLDNQVWVRFQERQLLSPAPITADKPFWSGSFWALYPRRSAPGTNSFDHQGWRAAVLWTPPVLSLVDPFGEPSVMKAALTELAAQGRVTDPAARRELQAVGFLDGDGRPAVPVIRQQVSDPVHAASLALSTKISDAVVRMLQSSDFSELTGSSDKGEALEITYHEFMWELLAYLDQAGVVRPPAILSAPHPDPRQVHDLAFIVVLQQP